MQRFDLLTAPLDEGTVLLEASAGTGKTYTLVGILLRLLLEKTIDRLDQALVVTFTIAATDELKNRLRAALRKALAVCEGTPTDDPFFQSLAHHGRKGARILREALDLFDQVAIATIHGFCKRVLDEAAFESREPFDLDFAIDEAPLWQRAAEDALRLLRQHDCLMLGSLLHVLNLPPDKLVAIYRLWQRYPAVLLEPTEPQPAVHIETLRAAVHTAAARFDDTGSERLLSFDWYAKKSPLQPDASFAVSQLRLTLRKAPELALRLLRDLAPSHLKSALKKHSRVHLDHPFLSACEEVRTGCQLATAHLRSALLRSMHEQLGRHKRTERVLSFQDLLSRTHDAVRDEQRAPALLATLRARYHVALIDEFQDTDSIQYGIFSTCFQNCPLFLVGDPKQSIYSFRGADLQTYLQAHAEAIATRTLDTNYRSSAAMVQATSLLFGSKRAFVETKVALPQVRAKANPRDLLIQGDPGAALQWRFVPPPDGQVHGNLWPADLSEPRIAADVTAAISRLLRGRCRLDDVALQPRHIAVLTRTNKQAMVVQATLRQAGIVSAIGKAGDVFATDELVEIERILLAILRPNDAGQTRAAMSTRLWGHDAASLCRIDHDDSALDLEIERLERWRHLWLRRGFVVMKEQMLADLDTEARLLAQTGGERRLTNCQQLFEMLHEAEHAHHLSPEGLVQWLQHERNQQEEIDYQRRELRLESDEDAVQILTVHGSKGLQYEIVFCPFLWDGRAQPRPPLLLQRGSTRQLEFETGNDDDDAVRASDGERLAEDVRLCYVAITRSKRRCYVHWGALGSPRSGCWRSALGWLLRPERPPAEQQGWQKTWADACKASVPDFAKQLRDLVAGSDGTMSVDEVPLEPAVVQVPQAIATTTRNTRRATRKPHAFALHSFTSMVAGATAWEGAPEVQDPENEVPDDDTPPPAAHGIFGFQRGATAGQCLHSILEHIDIDALDAQPAADLVTSMLRQFGLLDPAAHPGVVEPVADVLGNLRALAQARATADGPTIAELCRQARIAEWQFTLPLPHAEVRGLAAVFRQHGSDVARGYADRLDALPQRTLHGFLGGFADLVTAHEGRFWVLDWKSNHLGDALGDYGRDALLAAMFEHDYVLQYHLYVLALHRHLAQRLPGYAPERHLGGVCYPFLRGARAGSDNGMFFDRPPTGLVTAMDRWANTPHPGGRT